jgi:hypothetical protein
VYLVRAGRESPIDRAAFEMVVAADAIGCRRLVRERSSQEALGAAQAHVFQPDVAVNFVRSREAFPANCAALKMVVPDTGVALPGDLIGGRITQA